MSRFLSSSVFFFFNDTATTEIYTLSLHDALPISQGLRVWFSKDGLTAPVMEGAWILSEAAGAWAAVRVVSGGADFAQDPGALDRKSTRLNSSHQIISYAVFCLKKKKKNHARADPLVSDPAQSNNLKSPELLETLHVIRNLRAHCYLILSGAPVPLPYFPDALSK